MAQAIITSVVTGGSNNHATVAEEANAYATDFVTAGIVGAITNTTGTAPATGGFAVNANGTPDMTVSVSAGVAYVGVTPTSQGAQVLRARMTATYTGYVINANSSGATVYDWIYLQGSSTAAANPDAAADDVVNLYTSRSTSNANDTGTPPTYGILLAVVTVANGATSITNGNIADKRTNASVFSNSTTLVATQVASGQPAIVRAAGGDTNVDLELLAKGTGKILLNNLNVGSAGGTVSSTTSTTYVDTGYSTTVTIGASGAALIMIHAGFYNSGQFNTKVAWQASGANTIAAADATACMMFGQSAVAYGRMFYRNDLSPGSTTFTLMKSVNGGTASYFGVPSIIVIPL